MKKKMNFVKGILSASGVAMSATSNTANAATAIGVISNVKAVTNEASTLIPVIAGLTGAALLFYFFVLLNKRGDERNGQDVPIIKLVLTGLAAGGLLAWSASQGIFTSFF